MPLDLALTDEDKSALFNLLLEAIVANSDPQSPRVQMLRAILAKLRPLGPEPPWPPHGSLRAGEALIAFQTKFSLLRFRRASVAVHRRPRRWPGLARGGAYTFGGGLGSRTGGGPASPISLSVGQVAADRESGPRRACASTARSAPPSGRRRGQGFVRSILLTHHRVRSRGPHQSRATRALISLVVNPSGGRPPRRSHWTSSTSACVAPSSSGFSAEIATK
jgi:hypothetical protein